MTPKTWKKVKLLDCIEIANGQVDPKKDPYKDMFLIAPNHIEQKTGRIL